MKVAIYARKSKMNEQGDSIQNQIKFCEEYIDNYFNNIKEIFVYIDEGFSGGNTHRPRFQQMLIDGQNNKFNILICYRLDRVSRNIAQFSNTYEILQKYKIEFISVKEQFDTSSPIGRAMLNIAMVFAQLERETIAERIKDNMHGLACTGRWLGGTCPTGFKSIPIEYYDKNYNKKKMFKLSPISSEIDLIILIFDKFLEFQRLRRVETYLFNKGIKTKNNCNFSAATIKDILINPVYATADHNIYMYFKNLGAKVYGDHLNYNGIYGVAAYNRTNQENKSPKLNPVELWIIAIGRHKGVISSHKWITTQKILKKNSRN